jgi:hypothetical protein
VGDSLCGLRSETFGTEWLVVLGRSYPPEGTVGFALDPQRGSARHTVDFPLLDGKNADVQRRGLA